MKVETYFTNRTLEKKLIRRNTIFPLQKQKASEPRDVSLKSLQIQASRPVETDMIIPNVVITLKIAWV